MLVRNEPALLIQNETWENKEMKRNIIFILTLVLLLALNACQSVTQESTIGEDSRETSLAEESAEASAPRSGDDSQEETSQWNIPAQIVDGDYDFSSWDTSALSRSPQKVFWDFCPGSEELLYFHTGNDGMKRFFYTMTPEGELTEHDLGVGANLVQYTEDEGIWYLMTGSANWKLYSMQNEELTELYSYPENQTERFYQISTNEVLVAEDVLYYTYQLIDRLSPAGNQTVAGGIGQIDLETGEKSIWLQEEGIVLFQLITVSKDQIVYGKTIGTTQSANFYRSVRVEDTVYTKTLEEMNLECCPVGNRVYYVKEGKLQAMDLSNEQIETIAEVTEDANVIWADAERVILRCGESFDIYTIDGAMENSFSINSDEEQGAGSDLCGLWQDRLIWGETYKEENKTVFSLYSTDLEGQNRQEIGKTRG